MSFAPWAIDANTHVDTWRRGGEEWW